MKQASRSESAPDRDEAQGRDSAALEGLTITDMLGYQVTMRKADHQILSEYFVGVFTKGVKYDSEKTGLGWKTDFIVPAEDLTLPTNCKMKRPAS